MSPARPEQQAQDQSVPRRTSPASSGSECSPPDLNHKESPKIYQIECQKECQKICQKVRQNRCKIELRIECQSICQKECQIECQNQYAIIYTSRWYVRRCQKLCQDNVSRWGSLEEVILGFCVIWIFYVLMSRTICLTPSLNLENCYIS